MPDARTQHERQLLDVVDLVDAFDQTIAGGEAHLVAVRGLIARQERWLAQMRSLRDTLAAFVVQGNGVKQGGES